MCLFPAVTLDNHYFGQVHQVIPNCTVIFAVSAENFPRGISQDLQYGQVPVTMLTHHTPLLQMFSEPGTTLPTS